MLDQNKTQATKDWIKEVVIGLGICPFASESFNNNQIKYQETSLEALEVDFDHFIKDLKEDNGFLIFDSTIGFDHLLDICENLEEYTEDYQLVSFHPEFKFNDTFANDRINFVNRSPYPMIHFLKADAIENLNLDESKGREINLKNEKTLNALTSDEFKKLFIKR